MKLAVCLGGINFHESGAMHMDLDRYYVIPCNVVKGFEKVRIKIQVLKQD